ncbi:hypothetical protein GGF32_000816 [Allomyces javanicus]|nr:hypothetical protein GGF32_000816 [Allomyces javanicus]
MAKIVLNWSAVLLAVCVLVQLAGSALAWSAFGHSAVASVARVYLRPATLNKVLATLKATNDTSLESVAPWADTIRDKYPDTMGLHFIPNIDAPHQGKCFFDVVKDCVNDKCVYAAINNEIKAIRNATASATAKSEATKFLIHFVGDLHQPLHATSFLKGGNTLPITFGLNATTGAPLKTNLHSSWDFHLPNKTVTKLHGGSTDKWIDSIVHRIGTEWRKQVPSWLKCPTEADQCVRGVESLKKHVCPVTWARESDAINCEHVFKDADFSKTIDEVQRNVTVTDAGLVDVSDKYWEAVHDVIDLQIARAGVRLAATLEATFN